MGLVQFYSILYFINKRQRWTKLRTIIFQIQLFSAIQKLLEKSKSFAPFKLHSNLFSKFH